MLVVQRTGWGKSAVYFVATALLRARGGGPTLIVSPLLALMRDQVDAARRAGLRAVTMNSANADEWAEVTAALAADEVDLLLVSPERLNNPRFRDEQLPRLAEATGLLVVDEAHCISDWGHDFRPDYRRIRDLLADLPAGRPVLATTATANARVVADVVEQLGAGGAPVRTVPRHAGPRRACGSACCRCPPPTPGSAGWPHGSASCRAAASSTPSRSPPPRTPPRCCARPATRSAPTPAAPTRPTGSSSSAPCATTRSRRWWPPARWGWASTSPTSASWCTSARPRHRSPTTSRWAGPVARPSAPTCCSSRRSRTARSGATSRPRRCRAGPDADAVLTALAESAKPMSTAALETVADVRRTRLELLLKVLDVEGAVRRVSGGWSSTGAGWTYDERALRPGRRGPRRRGCVDARLPAAPTAAGCGSCRRRSTTPAPPTAAAATAAPAPGTTPRSPTARVQAATRTLRKVGVPVEPRSQWPSGMSRLGVPRSGRIGADERVEQGRVVARLTDLGWGQRLRQLLAEQAPRTRRPTTGCWPPASRCSPAGTGTERPVAVVADALAAPTAARGLGGRATSPRSAG